MGRPYFHKLVLSSTIRERRLKLPESFVRKFRDELSVAAVLIVPGGIASRVGLKRADSKIWFQDGWQEFLERFSVRVGYFLVFRYEGNSSFNVFIYNLPSSEINYQFHALSGIEMPKRGKQNHIFEEMEDDEPEPLNHQSFNKSFNSPTGNCFGGSKHYNSLDFSSGRSLRQSLGSDDFHAGNHSTRDVGVQFDTLELRNSLDAIALHSLGTDLQSLKKPGKKKRKIDPNGQPSSTPVQHDGEMRFRFYESASARKRTVTAEERERAINAAKTFEPTNPFCRVVLRPSYLYRGCIMYLPSCFAEKHLNGISGFIKLQLPDGRQWPVRCLYKGGRAKFSQGWYEFTLENNLGEGDVCIFEVLRAREFILRVTVFRILESSGYAHRLTQ